MRVSRPVHVLPGLHYQPGRDGPFQSFCSGRVARSCLLRPLPIPNKPWSHITLDFVTGLPTSVGNTTILTVINRFSKAVHFIALPKLPSSRETADLLVRHVFSLHCIPTDIVSDRAPQFTSQVWRAFCKVLDAPPSHSSGLHPQSNGQSERANQEMEAALRCITHASPTSWNTQLPWVEYAHNTLVNASSGLSPFMASLGYQPPLFSELEDEIAVPLVQAHLCRWYCHVEAHTRCATPRILPLPVAGQ